jgi:hypothetical protein
VSQKSSVRKLRTKDGGAHRSWDLMMARCYYKKDKSYHNYGGRGIVVCSSWHNYNNFVSDMGHRPIGMTLERKNVNDGYGPDSCRWATRLEQSRNKRSNKINIQIAQEILGRMEHGESIKSIATRPNLSIGLVKDLRYGTSWGELDRPWLNGLSPPWKIYRKHVNCEYDCYRCPLKSRREQHRTKLTIDKVQEVLGRIEHGESKYSIAERMKISTRTVKDIKWGKTWPQLDRPWKNGAPLPTVVQRSKVLKMI